jgi:hypothetical protein
VATMNDWFVDKGLSRLILQWRARHPGAIVGTIADEFHKPPSGHIPEEDGSVDAGDFMEGGSVEQVDLDELAEVLRLSRDPRIAFVIRRQQIFSSTVEPRWGWRPYGGKYHNHTHVEVNDKHETDSSPWNLEGIDMEPRDVWEVTYNEYIDEDGKGRNPRTAADILYSTHRAALGSLAAAQRAAVAAERTAEAVGNISLALSRIEGKLGELTPGTGGTAPTLTTIKEAVKAALREGTMGQ